MNQDLLRAIDEANKTYQIIYTDMSLRSPKIKNQLLTWGAQQLASYPVVFSTALFVFSTVLSLRRFL